MGPIRASSSKILGSNDVDSENKKQGTKSNKPYVNSRRTKFKKHDHATGADDASDLPGVQKLKSTLRQTRRLLAKDNLAADVRVQTERRLKALEADIAHAEIRRKERTLALRYHKVKFFERKKVLRRIKQVKKQLSEGESLDSKKSSAELENELFELRVDLNYITHYPKLEKYISLFAPDQSTAEAGGNDDDSEDEDAAPPGKRVKTSSETDKKRETLRDMIRKKMEAEEMSGEPEMDSSTITTAGGSDDRKQERSDLGSRIKRTGKDVGSETFGGEKKKKSRVSASSAKASTITAKIGDDEFFEGMSE